MPYIAYEGYSPRPLQSGLISQAVEILRDYSEQGYKLTLRQLYYQFVARDLLPAEWTDATTGSTNNERSYKNLGRLVARARLAGLMDWYDIEDRTRNLGGRQRFEDPTEVLRAAAHSYHTDWWEGQTYRPEVWVEKDALIGVVERVAREHDTRYMSSRGYGSLSEVWLLGQRFRRAMQNDQIPVLIHLADHDPSGCDMSRDLEDRLRTFVDCSDEFIFTRIALNMDQIREYDPPPNPAKLTDSRSDRYVTEHGSSSWELDAIEPRELEKIIASSIDLYIDDPETMDGIKEEEQEQKDKILEFAKEWTE